MCVGAGAEAISPAVLRTAIDRALPLIERSAAQTLKVRDCFTCHHGAHAAMAQNEAWLLKTPAEDTEDRVYRLRALHLLNRREAMEVEVSKLLSEQRKDGGWGQMTFLDSDAYATGTVLAALVDTGAISVVSADYQRGVAYLVREQKADGSWHVKKRTRMVQPMFESGFPHEHDQFISYSASCWATYALLKGLPVDGRRGRADFVSKAGVRKIKRMANDEIRPRP